MGIKEEGITINREGKEKKIGADLVGDLYDDKFHKIQVFFDKSNAVVLVDCIQVARIPFPPLSGMSTESKLQIDGNAIVQDLSIICGLTDSEECCELESGLCYGFSGIS